eukprot:SAG31_NODE_15521_length_750_cov_1.956989_1_plen_72_part_10
MLAHNRPDLLGGDVIKQTIVYDANSYMPTGFQTSAVASTTAPPLLTEAQKAPGEEPECDADWVVDTARYCAS